MVVVAVPLRNALKSTPSVPVASNCNNVESGIVTFDKSSVLVNALLSMLINVDGSNKLFNFLHILKAEAPIVSILGKSMVVIFCKPKNAVPLIVRTLGTFIDSTFPLNLKRSFSMVTKCGISTDTNELHSANACVAITILEFCKYTAAKLEFSNARLPIVSMSSVLTNPNMLVSSLNLSSPILVSPERSMVTLAPDIMSA